MPPRPPIAYARADASACPVRDPSACVLPPADPVSSPTSDPMLGVNTEGAIIPCALIPWPASLATSADALSVARVQSTRNDGLTDAPPDRRLSAYQTLVPDKSSDDVTRCAAP